MADNRIQFTFEINDKGKVKVDGLTKSFVSLDNAVNKVSADLKRQQAELGKSSAGLQNTISDAGLAGATLTELGRTISDANFGIRGMANNLSQLSTLFITLVSKRGGGISGVTLAFKQLGRQLLGPLGIILAFQSLIAFIENMAMKNDAAKKSVDDLTESFSSQRKELNALAQTALSNVTDDYETIAEEAKLLAENSKEFAAGFDKLNKGVLDGVPGIVSLIDKYDQLLRVRDEIQDLKGLEIQDEEALRAAIIKRNELEKIFTKEKKKQKDDDIKTVKPEDPLTFGEVFGLDFGPSRQEVQDALDSFIEDAEDVINTQVANEQMPNLLKVLLGLDPNSREKELQVLRDTFDEILHETKEFKMAEAAIKEKYDIIERQEKFDHYSYMIGGLADFLDKAAQLNEQNKGLAKLSIIASAAAASIGIWESWFVKDKTFSPAPVKLAGAIATQGALVASTVAALRSLNSGTAPGQDSGGAGAGASQAPIFNVVGQSNVDQLGRSIAAARQEPLRAYVVESDITSAQQLENARIQQASIG
jgi:hypothetical protein